MIHEWHNIQKQKSERETSMLVEKIKEIIEHKGKDYGEE